LKDKPDPVALADEEYPAWLWTLLDSTKSAATAAATGTERKGRKNAAAREEKSDAPETKEESRPAEFDFINERKKLRAA
jgi:large subunit ribosomal protein L54